MKRLLKIPIYVIIIFLILEVGLRVLGYFPYVPLNRAEVQFLEASSQLGWEHIPGSYKFAVNTWGDTMKFVIGEDKYRVTKPQPFEGKQKEEILFIGGSFTMGFGLKDDQTFAWKLQQQFPDVNIRNLGVGAYGTYQSLLVLENQLKRNEKPKAVVYGFISHHRIRNVAEADWLNSISPERKTDYPQLTLPYVTLGADGQLVRQEPARLFRVPFSNHLSSSYMIQRTINNIFSFSRMRDSNEVLELLFVELQQLCDKNNVPFYVSILDCDRAQLRKVNAVFEKHSIASIDCNVPLNETNIFRDDGHPKEEVNDEWTRRISQRLVQDGILSTQTSMD